MNPIERADIKCDSFPIVENITAERKAVHTISSERPTIIDVVKISEDKAWMPKLESKIKLQKIAHNIPPKN